MSPDRPNHRVSSASGSPVCNPDQREVCILIVLSFSFSSSLDPPGFNPSHGHKNVANIQEEDSKEQLWIQLNNLFNNRDFGLSHTTDTAYEGIVPQRMHLSQTVYIHIINVNQSSMKNLYTPGRPRWHRSISPLIPSQI